MLPVVKLLEPGALVDLFFGADGGSVVEAMEVGQAGEEFFGVRHAVDAELQLIHILRIEVDGGLLGGSEAAIGAQVEGNRPCGQQLYGTQQRQQAEEPDVQSPSRRIFQR